MTRRIMSFPCMASLLLASILLTQLFGTANGDVRVDDGTPGAARLLPAITVDRYGSIYATWLDAREGQWTCKVYFAKSTDGGRTFSRNIRVSSASALADYSGPSIAVDDSGLIYVAWCEKGISSLDIDFDIYLAKSIDGGESFLSGVRVDHGGILKAVSPCLGLGKNGEVYVAWEDRQGNASGRHVYFNKSSDHGETFHATDKCVDCTQTIGSSGDISMAVTGNGEIGLVWNIAGEDSGRIFFDKSIDGGMTFREHIFRVDDFKQDNLTPVLGADLDGNYYVLWYAGDAVWGEDNSVGADIFFDGSTDGGVTFYQDKRVNEVVSTGFFPSMAVDPAGNIFVVWENIDGGTYDSDIFFAMSTDGGFHFSRNIRVDSQQYNSSFPCVATDGSGSAYVAWEQQTISDGPYDAIFFREFNAFSTIGSKGDVNCDGWINVLDVNKCVAIILGLAIPNDYTHWAADYDADGLINSLDILRIIRKMLRLDACEP